MLNQQYQVREFMLKACQDLPPRPVIPSGPVQKLRASLHREEAVIELELAFLNEDKIEVLDSICDSLVVIFGTAAACGFSPEQVKAGFEEVMRSNMSKFIDGHRREDGKWIKGKSYTPPNLEPIVNI